MKLRAHRVSAMMLAMVSMVAPGLPAGAVAQVPDGEAMLAKIVSVVREFESKYVGTYSRRRVVTKRLDADSRELQQIKEFVVDSWDYHGENPVRRVLECKIDGAKKPTSDCEEEQRLDPPYRLFDDEAPNRYRLQYGGRIERDGRPLHKVTISPREETARHLKGDLFFGEESKVLAAAEMTLADYPFGVQELEIRTTMAEKDGRPVLQKGATDVYVYVPLVMNARLETRFEVLDSRPLETREGTDAR